MKESWIVDKRTAKNYLKQCLPEGKYIAQLRDEKLIKEILFLPELDDKSEVNYKYSKGYFRVICQIGNFKYIQKSTYLNTAIICCLVCCIQDYFKSLKQ